MNTEFINLVQSHEREWGGESYSRRPDLQALLSATIVVFWQVDKEQRLQATIHDDMQHIENELTKFVMRAAIAPPKKRLVHIYAKGRKVCIQSVRIKFDFCE